MYKVVDRLNNSLLAFGRTEDKMVTINGVDVRAKEFGFDGCHKIYLVNTPEDKTQLTEYGYEFLPIEDLPEVWENSCELKFISDADLKADWVRQDDSHKAVIKND